MNLIAMIGIVNTIQKINENFTSITLKVQKPFWSEENLEEIFDEFPIELNNTIFKYELKNIESGNLIGFKGRLKYNGNNISVVAERLQLF